MDRSGLSRILLPVMIFLGVYLIFNKGCNKEKGSNKLLAPDVTLVAPLASSAAPGAPCVVETEAYKATVAPLTGGLTSYELKGAKYVEHGKPIDIASRTTRDTAGNAIANFAPLRTHFRNKPDETQVPGDLVAFTTEKQGNACVLKHETEGLVEITRVVRPGPRPYEIETETTVKNLAKEPRKHSFSTSLYALQFKSEEGGMLSRPSPNSIFKAGCAANGKLEMFDKGSARDWKIVNGNLDYAAIASGYLGQALIPTDNAGAHCAVLAQDRDDGGEQTLYHSIVAYPPRELGPDQAVTYKQLAFLGPKERNLLAAAAGGGRRVDDLIELGMFAIIAKKLVWFLGIVHGLIGSWGIAIILLTITVRTALLPLTIPQIRSSLAMRRLKPDLDALNAKYADDPQAKMLATSQLYKKEKINPLAGCLPAVVQMPVWFALYTALQTAMELYHEKFLFWHDLSAPDPRFILPLVLGATMFLQQKITPMQMDPAQQKVLLYFMPAMFTVFMLFLPAGLGVYMLTNSVLGIVQTLAVEKYYASQQPAQVKVTQVSSEEKPKGKEPRSARELARKGD
jgi:YidC/Oxa1 family membrane protein insertase